MPRRISISGHLCLLITLFTISCVPITSNTQSGNTNPFIPADKNYDPSVGMVQIYAENNDELRSLENPAFQLGKDNGIMMKFDLIENNYENVYVSFMHCSNDWQASGLPDIRFLDQYNSFAVNQYEYSANTRIPYVEYTIELPLPTISGNYLLKVTRNANENELIFTRRIVVFENRVLIDIEPQISSSVKYRNEYQEINFSINYNGIDVTNVLADIKIVLLQNHRWQTAIPGLRPTLIRQDTKYLEYHPFNLENNFPGGNEFRFFDIRTIDYRGMNIAYVEKKPEYVSAYLNVDKSKGELAYTQVHEDLNGGYYLQNTDPNDLQLQSEYVNTHFELLTDKIEGEVYIIGKYNNWKKDSTNVMTYDPSSMSYKGSVWLKQGYYNYAYEVMSAHLPPYYFEGSKYQTENEYEILCYYRNPANNYDELVGYRKVNSRL